jgi:hypothetical protein
MSEKASLVAVILTGILIVTMLAFVGVFVTDINKPCVDGTVISVGGCDKYGICGVSVLTKDGIVFGSAHLPVLNQNVCVHPK